MMTQIFTELSRSFYRSNKITEGYNNEAKNVNLTTGSIIQTIHNNTLTNVCFYCCGLIIIFLLCQNQKYATIKMWFCISITEPPTQK